MLRVLHVIGSMNRGGAETMIMNLFRAVDRKNIVFDFVVHTDQEGAFDQEILELGGRIYHCPRINRGPVVYDHWWNAFFRHYKDRYKVIHGHLGSTAAIYLRIARKYGLYTIAHSHSSGTDYSLHSMLYKVSAFPTRYIADYFFACSKAAGIDRYGKAVVNSSRFSVLNNAINSEQFRYDAAVRKKVREEFDLGEDLLIGHVGRFDGPKNQKFLVDIFADLKKKNPDSKLMLVGDGPLKAEVEKQAEELGAAGSVFFTGLRPDVHELMQAMDLIVFPSVFEGLPVTLVEAQSAGLRCIISDKVPAESIIVDELVTVKRLDEDPSAWSDEIISRSNYDREDTSGIIIQNGYDIYNTARKMEAFYLECIK